MNCFSQSFYSWSLVNYRFNLHGFIVFVLNTKIFTVMYFVKPIVPICYLNMCLLFPKIFAKLFLQHNSYPVQTSNCNPFYNIAFVNSERWLAKSRVDITLCQHGKFPATLLLKFFVLYYKRNIKHFFRIDIQLYQHSWKLEKLDIVWKHSALRASGFHTISRFSNFHSCLI